jgi:hemerythrin-like domain-containing protein
MSNKLRRLRQDHANLQKLLFILERQIAALDRRERPDWDIIEGAVEYLQTYPDLHHHPLEDRILRRLQAKDPAAAAPFQGLAAEHGAQRAALQRIAAATHQVLQDASMPRQTYIELLTDFAAKLRQHIRMEEEAFFPAAAQSLDGTDWAALDSEASDPPDPLAGDPVELRFAALRKNLESWDVADRYQHQAD